MTDVILEHAKACMYRKSLQSCRHILLGVELGPVPGVHLPGAKALTGSFAMNRFAGDSALAKLLANVQLSRLLVFCQGFCP